MSKRRTFHVQTTSFTAAFGGGAHTYISVREIKPNGDTIVHEMVYELTASEAKALNRTDSWDGWREGMETARFDFKDDAKKAAQAWLDERATGEDDVFWGLDYYRSGETK